MKNRRCGRLAVAVLAIGVAASAWSAPMPKQGGFTRQRQESQDRINEPFGQLMKGTENYVDPATNEQIDLSAGYKGAWSNGKGKYILSDSPGFDPVVELKEDWKALRREQRR